MSQQEEKKQKKSLAVDKVKVPPKDHPHYDYVGGLLESVKSDFRVFGEVQNLILEKVNRVEKRTDATFEEVGSMKIEMSEMNDKLDENTMILDGHTKRLDRIENKLGIKEMITV